MKKLLIALSLLFFSTLSYGQSDSLKVFFIGNVKGERFKVYWCGKEVLSFRGSESYKYSFKINRIPSWETNGNIANLMVYRKGRFGLKYVDLNPFVPYESKKYLIIWRNPFLKKSAAVEIKWSDKEPKRIPNVK